MTIQINPDKPEPRGAMIAHAVTLISLLDKATDLPLPRAANVSKDGLQLRFSFDHDSFLLWAGTLGAEIIDVKHDGPYDRYEATVPCEGTLVTLLDPFGPCRHKPAEPETIAVALSDLSAAAVS